MHPSTEKYIALTATDDAAHQAATAALRTGVAAIKDLTQRAAAKGAAMVDIACDETNPKVCALLGEGHDRQQTLSRLAAEWQDKTVRLLQQLKDVEAFDARLVAVAAAKTETSVAS